MWPAFPSFLQFFSKNRKKNSSLPLARVLAGMGLTLCWGFTNQAKFFCTSHSNSTSCNIFKSLHQQNIPHTSLSLSPVVWTIHLCRVMTSYLDLFLFLPLLGRAPDQFCLRGLCFRHFDVTWEIFLLPVVFRRAFCFLLLLVTLWLFYVLVLPLVASEP